MTANAVFVYNRAEEGYKFSDSHPFHPQRLRLAVDLLNRLDSLRGAERAAPAAADAELLATSHRRDYLQIVQALSAPQPEHAAVEEAERYGLQDGDTPYFPGMHDAASLIVGGSVLAAELVMSGRAEHAYHMAGGLHHAFPDRAAGFCIYNDAAIAIADIRRRYGARVMYIDTDVHHGDGVQWAFYNDPNVFTYSIHETGKYLFPGTGYVYERGNADGFGSCLNLPVEPYTEDDSWLECFTNTVAKAAESFRPDIIVSQHGCDAHAFDPLSHVHCSMEIYRAMPAVIHSLAHRYTGGRWVALGGGGYDIWRVVPRAWALVWLEMIDHPVAAALRGGANPPLPAGWLARWRAESPVPLPDAWLDDPAELGTIPRRGEIEQANRRMMEIAAQYC